MKLLRALLYSLVFCATFLAAAYAADWPPVTPDELKMTAEPLAPGAPAIILYRQVDRDDSGSNGHENTFVRIKILKEEGRKYADVEIPYYKGNGSQISHVWARTIHPDGSVSEFKGKPFDKSIVKARGLKYMAKTFTLPDVQVGSVIEYAYTTELSENYIFDSHWILNDELFTKHAKFSLKPYNSSYGMFNLRWTWHLLPPGTEPPKEGPGGLIRMEVNNVPAFQTEDYMPPPEELKSRVDFTYSEDMEKDPTKFWKNLDKKLNSRVESFVGKRKAMEQAVAQIISPSDTPEIKLQKIYARVQSLRNISYEPEKTVEELKRSKEKDNSNVEDVWKRGYGDVTDLNWLFLGLARAAGFEAYPVFVSDRYHYFFDRSMMDAHKLDYNLVLVKVNGKDEFYDPGAAFTPCGMLMWSETAVQGLRLDKDGGTWIQTPLPDSTRSRTIRQADLKLSQEGDLEGKLTVTYTGLDAMHFRVEEYNEDAADRKKTLEDTVKEYIPVATDVKLTNQPDWTSSSTPLIAEFDIKIGGWVSAAGRRALLPVGLFSASEKRVFEHTERIHPIYFEYPNEKEDDITVSLPPGWKVNSAPPANVKDGHVVLYSLTVDNNQSTVKITRKLNMNVLILEQKYYLALRNFFQEVRTGDEEQILLQPGSTTAQE